MDKLFISPALVMFAARNVAVQLKSLSRTKYSIFGIPRGGVPAALAVVAAMRLLGCKAMVVDTAAAANVIVDDICDSGKTMKEYRLNFPGRTHAALFARPKGLKFVLSGMVKEGWLVFPWEAKDGKDDSVTDNITRILQAIGEDPTREGLLETPARVVKAWGEWFSGYGKDPAEILKTFKDGADNVDEMVVLTDIPVHSFCEHHMIPFIGVAHVAYIPNGRIVGLSKLARLVDMYARRLQVQERLSNQIVDAMMTHLKPLGAGVVITANHLCMATRGVRAPGVATTTSAVRGVFRSKPAARAEFLSLVHKK